MPEKMTTEIVGWARVIVAILVLALVITMICAMFSSRKGIYPNQRSNNDASLGEQFNTFQDNVEKRAHRGVGEVL